MLVSSIGWFRGIAFVAAAIVALSWSRSPSAYADDDDDDDDTAEVPDTPADDPPTPEPANDDDDVARPDDAGHDDHDDHDDADDDVANADPETDDDIASGGGDPDGDGLDSSDDDPDTASVTVPEFDEDGDGVVSAEEEATRKEYAEAFADVPDEVSDEALDARPENAELVASMTPEQLRELVRLARAKVLSRLTAKMEKKQDARMAKIGKAIAVFSLAGFLLLLMPFALGKKYPNQTSTLFKYSGLAALVFVVSVNFFGGVLLCMRGVQGVLGEYTNPQIAIAGGFFDSLDRGAEDYVVMGKELFGPTLEQLSSGGDEQPAVALLENGKKIIEDAQVFVTIANGFKKLDFVFAALPIVLLAVTLLLFLLAIRPTLLEIVRLPAQAASGVGSAGADVIRGVMRRIGNESLATLCTLGVLVGLTVVSAIVLGRVVGPALDALISYFSLGLTYLQFVAGGSSGLTFVMLFSVILFLVLNLAVVILSMAFFLGKSQKIFQQRFHDKVPLASHRRFWTWGIPAVLIAQLVPLLYLLVARWGVELIENKLLDGVTDAEQVNWTALMLAGPLFLVVGFGVFLWAARGVKAIKFLATYKVKGQAHATVAVVDQAVDSHAAA